jgi:hypothetical protein
MCFIGVERGVRLLIAGQSLGCALLRDHGVVFWQYCYWLKALEDILAMVLLFHANDG